MADLSSELKLYRHIVGARIRSDWQYRTSFFTFTASQATVNVLEFVVILIIIDLVPNLGGWTGSEVAFLYGLATVPFGVADVLVSSIDRTSTYVRTGTMDRVLLRPVSALLQITALEFELRRIGKVLPSLSVLIWAVLNVEVVWTVQTMLVLFVSILSGTIIYAALWILTASLSFWFVDTQEATNAFTYGGQFANQYPLHLYSGWIRAILGWIVPLAFVAYVPAISILEATGPQSNPLGLPHWMVYTSPIVALLTMACALTAWRIGIRHYQSTGS